jgi:hypothetical protein
MRQPAFRLSHDRGPRETFVFRRPQIWPDDAALCLLVSLVLAATNKDATNLPLLLDRHHSNAANLLASKAGSIDSESSMLVGAFTLTGGFHGGGEQDDNA